MSGEAISTLKNQHSMNISLLITPIILVLALGCSSEKNYQPSSDVDSGEPSYSLLVFSKTTGFRHQSIEAGIEALKRIGMEHDFYITFTESSEFVASDSLFTYDAIVFLNTTGTLFTEDERSFLRQFIQSGGGFVGIHSAADTEYDWPWYEGLVGAYFDNHPNNPNVRSAVVEIVNNDHPAVNEMPKRWERTDEWYNYRSFRDGLNILMKLDTGSYSGSDHPGNHPIAWYREYDGGRSFYTGMGHTEESFSEPEFLRHLTGGIFYAIGAEPPAP
jgi:cytochrome c